MKDHPVDLDSSKEGWYEDPEYAAEFEPILWLIMEENDIRMDPTLNAETQVRNGEVGVLKADFWKWGVRLNWSTQWMKGIPPHHYRVLFNHEEVGILSPYELVRTCWKCRLGDPREGREWKPEMYYVRGIHPEAPPELPWCLPAHRCRGPLYEGKLLGTCGEIDWHAYTIPRGQLQVDAAEALAVKANKDSLASTMAVPYNPSSQLKAQDIGAGAPSGGLFDATGSPI